MNQNKTMDDELEEGEIADEVYPETKDKVLPRRYVLHENKSVTIRHKKTCKHVSHHHEEKHKKLKGISLKPRNSRKKHHKTCPKRLGKLQKYLLNKISSKSKLVTVPSDAKTEFRNDNYDLASRKKSAFKNYTSPPRKISKPQTSVANNYGSLESNFPKLISDYMKVQAGLRTLNDSLKSVSNENRLTAFDSESEGKLYIQNNKNISENLPDSTTKQSNEESEDEDEDELRRIALASVKRTVMDEFVENNVDASPSDSVKNSGMYSHDQETDNYEIVDMDVDENNQDLNDDVDDQLFGIDTAPLHTEFFDVESKNPVDDQLFVIDTKPSLHNEFFNVKSESSSPNISHSVDKCGISPSQLDNDFEVELLRAEKIANMKSNSGKRERGEIQNVLSENSERKSPVTTPNSNFLPQTANSLESVPVTKNHTKHLKVFDLHKAVAKENIPRERLIITLNNDSSSEESDQEDENMNRKDPLQMNSAVASLEALISDARHNSDENKYSNGDKINKAVSCLSKAQQEEYNALMKILAEKEKISVQSEQIPFKKIKAHSPLDDLKLLEKKLSIAKTNLEKEQQQLGKVVKEVTVKKSAYMKSKLTVQHLKEQLHAAEKVRISNLKLWSKSVEHFKTIKKSISKRQTLIKQLQIQCSKLGVGIQGQNYALPAVSNSSISLKKEPTS